MTTLIQARVDSKLKEEAESIMGQLGITLNEAIRMFLLRLLFKKAYRLKQH